MSETPRLSAMPLINPNADGKRANATPPNAAA
jgi:hypothetical protein